MAFHPERVQWEPENPQKLFATFLARSLPAQNLHPPLVSNLPSTDEVALAQSQSLWTLPAFFQLHHYPPRPRESCLYIETPRRSLVSATDVEPSEALDALLRLSPRELQTNASAAYTREGDGFAEQVSLIVFWVKVQ